MSNFVNSREKAEGADIRVISFNLNFTSNPAPETRIDRMKEIVDYFSPDVIGIQEMNGPWHEAFDAVKGDYEIFDPTNGTEKPNNSCIAYNVKKAKLLDHGIKIFSQGDRPHLRLANWGYFEDIACGKRYIVVNTHWDIVAEYVMTQAIEMGELVRELVAKYNCAVISTGDYNKLESSDEHKKYVEIAQLHNSKYTALVKGNVHDTEHRWRPSGSMPNLEQIESIDHILGNDKVEFSYFTVITDQIALDISDHCPIFADIKLK